MTINLFGSDSRTAKRLDIIESIDSIGFVSLGIDWLVCEVKSEREGEAEGRHNGIMRRAPQLSTGVI